MIKSHIKLYIVSSQKNGQEPVTNISSLDQNYLKIPYIEIDNTISIEDNLKKLVDKYISTYSNFVNPILYNVSIEQGEILSVNYYSWIHRDHIKNNNLFFIDIKNVLYDQNIQKLTRII